MSFRTDNWIAGFDSALRVIAGVAAAARTSPALSIEDVPMNEADRRHSAGLMRVNHVGEVCAQALYQAQGQFARSAELTRQFAHAAREEEDHLAWTAERLAQLGSRTSFLNPVWFAGSYLLGMVAARAGDAQSLGFVVETERQVEAHLSHHLDTLPVADTMSRAIVLQMRDDEAAHGAAAQAMGAGQLPQPARVVMGFVSKVMTRTAYYL
ncbi:MAG: ubiquinone biosynthesis monooxygenase Coq7 [Bradyrhizobium sp.]|jgi:ubiquinone biosynthesis monooxygenase Coq7